MLLHRFLKVMFLQIIMIEQTSLVSSVAQNVSFGMLGASTLPPWVTMGRPRSMWEHGKETLGSRLGLESIRVDFATLDHMVFSVVFDALEQRICICTCLIPDSFL